MMLVVDIHQGFKIDNNEFIVKELADYDEVKMYHNIFKPPYTFEFLSADIEKQVT